MHDELAVPTNLLQAYILIAPAILHLNTLVAVPSPPCNPNNVSRQGVARAECQKAYDSALAAFQDAFKEEGCEDEAQLYDTYQVREGI